MSVGSERNDEEPWTDDDMTVPIRTGEPADDWFVELALQARRASDAAVHLLIDDAGAACSNPTEDPDDTAVKPMKASK